MSRRRSYLINRTQTGCKAISSGPNRRRCELLLLSLGRAPEENNAPELGNRGETWLAAASSELTGERPELVACILEAATRFDSVASTRSCTACTPSGSEYCREWDRTSSRIFVTALTTDFIGVSTRVGALPRPAERRESMADKKVVRCTSGIAPSAETGS